MFYKYINCTLEELSNVLNYTLPIKKGQGWNTELFDSKAIEVKTMWQWPRESFVFHKF